ncbi:MAG: hypothetical protein DRQ39_06135 [Gammaproteobacteria bacterium]|nr:MAG: hypothetical protein DRQ39_06135 [Gammaproteobacteria bacterium]
MLFVLRVGAGPGDGPAFVVVLPGCLPEAVDAVGAEPGGGDRVGMRVEGGGRAVDQDVPVGRVGDGGGFGL